jgi:RNA polymerase sigma-70 factor (ECF subfamily)
MWMMEDRALLDAFREGRRDALLRIYELYRQDVVKLLRGGFSFGSGGERHRFTGYTDAFSLEEALQETFLKAFSAQARQGYNGLQPFRPYLLGIARNLVIDDFRRRRRELRLFVPEPLVQPAELGGREAASAAQGWGAQERNPERALIERQQAEILGAFLETLEAEHRALVQHHFVDRLSQEEAAKAMGVDRNRVRRLIQEVRMKLLRFMKSRGHIQALDARELMAHLAWVAGMI